MVVPSVRMQVEWGARVSNQRVRVPAYVLIVYVASMNIVYYISTYGHFQTSQNRECKSTCRSAITPFIHSDRRRRRCVCALGGMLGVIANWHTRSIADSRFPFSSVVLRSFSLWNHYIVQYTHTSYIYNQYVHRHTRSLIRDSHPPFYSHSHARNNHTLIYNIFHSF